jgi:hypothetical protein
MSEALKIKTLILILIAGILLTCSNSMLLVNAQPTQTSLILAVSSLPLGKPFSLECTIEATLKDENGNPLPNMDIDFSYECLDQADKWHTVGTAKTDSNGVASLTYRSFNPFPHETYNVTARFRTTTNYAQSSSEKVAIARAVDYNPHLAGGGLIAVTIIGVIGFIVFRRRKKATTIPVTIKGEKKMRINPLQIGFSIIMGWVVFVLVGIFPFPIIGEAMYWIVPLLGESFIVLGFIEKERMISPQRTKTLLQIGIVVIIMWVLFVFASEGPYDLGLPKLYIPIGYAMASLPLILFGALPVLGLILLVLGIVLKIRKKS